MKRLLSITAVALVMGGVFSPAAHAQFAWGGGNINVTQSQLTDRVNRGVRTGALTRSEAASLRTKLARFAQIEFNMRRGGLSFNERKRLNAELSRISADVNRQLTDSERRYNGRYNNRPGWHHR